eukprot:4980048-Pyramimonas_sp.AAC.1
MGVGVLRKLQAACPAQNAAAPQAHHSIAMYEGLDTERTFAIEGDEDRNRGARAAGAADGAGDGLVKDYVQHCAARRRRSSCCSTSSSARWALRSSQRRRRRARSSAGPTS